MVDVFDRHTDKNAFCMIKNVTTKLFDANKTRKNRSSKKLILDGATGNRNFDITVALFHPTSLIITLITTPNSKALHCCPAAAAAAVAAESACRQAGENQQRAQCHGFGVGLAFSCCRERHATHCNVVGRPRQQ